MICTCYVLVKWRVGQQFLMFLSGHSRGIVKIKSGPYLLSSGGERVYCCLLLGGFYRRSGRMGPVYEASKVGGEKAVANILNRIFHVYSSRGLEDCLD
jgi:hypothetical protein